ncbi:MAG: hypothetical protein R3200_12805 [Xanthomonadales bacterium]|nr:hypothetical protein [Xanthomonadales bacterium]
MSRLPYLVFFLSGFAALTFETLWFRVAGLVFGNSVWGATVVLAAFMAGLAGGTAFLALAGHRLRLGFRFFAAIEIIIGLSGLAIVLLLPDLASALAALFQSLDSSLSLNLVRFVLAFVVLVVPSLAMGMTLPTIVHALHQLDSNYGQILGRLYGWNTAGAVIGALAGEVAFIRWYGVTGTAILAAGLNGLAALLALHLRRRLGGQLAAAAPQVSLRPETREGLFSSAVLRLMIVAGLLGFLMLALEILWFRQLLWFHASTSLTFATMLAVVLAGIALGGLLAGWAYARERSLHRYNRILLILTGLAALAPFLLLIRILWQIADVTSWAWFIGLCLVVMLPSAVLSGVLFTTVGKALSEQLLSDRRVTALLLLSNTLGAALGALAGTLVLIPRFGVQGSIIGIAVAYGLAALLIPGSGAGARSTRSNRSEWFAAGAAALVLALIVGLTATTSMRPFYSNYYRDNGPNLTTSVVGFRETPTETILYHRVSLFGAPKFYRLITNGHSMSGSTTFARRFMKLYVYLPQILHPDMRDVLLISYGVGSTAKALTDTRSIEHIDVVDISRDVLEMSSVVFSPEENPLNDPRVNVHIEDGRFFLGTTPRAYDLITADPPPPKNAGIVNLYTQDYFELLYDRLNEGGMATYWLPVFDLTEEDALAITRAFCNAFDDCSLWSGTALNWILLGVRGDFAPVDPDHFAAQWMDPVVVPELRELGLEFPEQIGSLFLADDAYLDQVTETTKPVTDDFPLRLTNELEPTKAHSQVLYDLLAARRARARFQESDFYQRIWPDEVAGESLFYFETQRMLNDLVVSGRQRIGNRWHDLQLMLTETELRTLPLWAMGSDVRSLEIVHEALESGDEDPRLTIHLAYEAMVERDYPRAIEYFQQYIQTTPFLEDSVPLQLSFAHCLAGDLAEARRFFGSLAPSGRNPQEWAEFEIWFEARCGGGQSG